MTLKMTDRIKRRMVPERPMVSISLRLPEDVIEELKEIAPGMGFSGYQPLIRAFIGQGLRDELARIEAERLTGEQTTAQKMA
jgi:hypothetical protein